jgi:hypothetical protein
MGNSQTSNDLTVEFSFSPPSDWDSLLDLAGFSTGFTQSSCWANILIELDKAEPIYIKVNQRQTGQPVLGLLIFIKKPYDRETNRISPTSYLLGQSKGKITFTEGPFNLTDDTSLLKNAYSLLLDWLDDFCSQNGYYALESGGMTCLNPLAIDDEKKNLLEERGFSVEIWATYLVNLSFDKDILYQKLDRAAKKQLRKANEQGLEAKEISDWQTYLTHFVIPYQQFENTAGRIPPTQRSFEVMWEQNTQNNYHFFYIKDGSDEVLAVLGAYGFNRVATEITSAVHPRVFEEHLAAQDLLHWEIIRYYQENGYAYFNLAGVNPDPQTPKERGIRQFKAKWGGEYRTFYRYSKQYPSLIRKVIKFVKPIRKNR